MSVLGVDPGAHGAIALLDEDGSLLWVEDSPSTLIEHRRVALNAPLLAEIIARSHARIVYCEFVGPRPTDGTVGAFAFGRARGILEGICGAYNMPIEFITPQAWKRCTGVPPGIENKQMARTKAIAKWPNHADYFKRVKDIDRAEACLIGLAGLERENIKIREVA